MSADLDKPSLSRGLDAILKLHDSSCEELQNTETVSAAQLQEIPVGTLFAGKFQPRKIFDQEDLQSLSNSIKAQGIVQPLIVRQVGQHSFEIIAGERRWRAAKLAGLSHVPVVIRQIDDDVAAAFSLIENIQRKDLNPIEEALALQRLINEFNLSHDEVATNVGRSRTAVTNILRLLTLDDEVKDILNQGAITMGHARALVTLDAKLQRKLAKWVVDKTLSVRQTEELVRSQVKPKNSQATKHKLQDPQILELTQRLDNVLSTQTQIRVLSDGRYQVSLKVENKSNLLELIDRLTGITS